MNRATNQSMLTYVAFNFVASLLLMFELFLTCRWLKCCGPLRDSLDGQVRLVICTKIQVDLVHPTWRSCSINATCVCPTNVWGIRVSDTSWFCSLCYFLEFCRWLKWCGMVWYPDGLVSLVACTNASLVHATWLTGTIRVVAVSNLSMRHKVNWTKTILCLLREELQAVAIRGNKWRRGFGILLWN